MIPTNNYQKRIEAALRDPKNLGELEGADAVGTAGSAACGDMIRLWIKFKEQAGKRVVDKATFQSFGCEPAIAVASLATEMIRGKTAEEVLAMSAEELATGLGPLPPVKIHCSQLVESALHSALQPQSAPAPKTDPAKHPGVVKSPMVGVAYLSAEPGAAPYVSVGQTVDAGATLLLIEAMKTFNQIKAPKAGTVKEILVHAGAPVEYDEPLLIIE